jgi:hypothetical protein
MKKLVITFEETDQGMISCEVKNTGFNAAEIVGFLEMKKIDTIDQMNHPKLFKRYFIDEDGERLEIVKEGK